MSRFGAIPVEQSAQPASRFAAPVAEEPGFFAKAADLVTGNLRETPETEAAPDWAGMPEMNQLTSIPGWKAAIGTMMTSPEETVKVLQSNFPGIQVRHDEKGNFMLRSSMDGKEYAIKPGFQISDIPRAAGAMLAFTPAGRATSVMGAGVASAGTQAAIEASQAASGGEFNPADVLLSGVTGAAVPAVVKGVKALAGGMTPKVAAAANAAPDQVTVPPAAAPVAAAPAEAVAAKEAQAAVDFGTLAKQAAGNGMGSQKAKEQLAALADINPEAKAAADALGVNLPPDVISDSKLLQETIGLSRSVQGSEASTAWGRTIEGARAKADEALAKIDASPDIATLSETIKGSLGNVRQDLDNAAGLIYRQIDEVVPKESAADLPATQQAISNIISEVGEENLSAAEKRLYKLATDPSTTYGALLREKSQIGAAMRGKVDANPYGSVESGALKRLYGALADDQLTVVGNIAGEDARNNLRYANQLTAKKKALETRIVNAFGKEGEGSIATKLTSAIKTGSKGDITALNKVIKTVPKELRKEALASAIMAQARTPRGDFSFGAFESMYQGLRKNGPVYAALSKEIGPEGSELLRSLYVVSKRINTAENKILKTGKANQALVATLTADGIVKRIMQSSVGRGVVTTVGGTVGGPIGGTAAAAASSALSSADKNVVEKISKLLTSQEFEKLIQDAAEKGAAKAAEGQAAKRLANSPAFIAYAKAAKLGKEVAAREAWIRTAVLSAQQTQEPRNGR